jgi:hypothetical protein
MLAAVTAFTTSDIQRYGLYGLVGAIIVAVLLAIVVQKIIGKIISVAFMGLLAFGIWTQRTNIQDCVNKAKVQASAPTTAKLECTFFGTKIKIDPKKLQDQLNK